MKIALIDNGSLAPASHLALRQAAQAIGVLAGVPVQAVSWKHSSRVAAEALGGVPAWTLGPWLRHHLDRGERAFALVPFFISPQGAVGSALQGDIEAVLSAYPGAAVRFTGGLAEAGLLPSIVIDRVHEALGNAASSGLPGGSSLPFGISERAALAVVDHGGPAAVSARLRDAVAAEVRGLLGRQVRCVEAASMESPAGAGFEFNRPLLADLLRSPAFSTGPILIAPLFLAPGRHAGPNGDLARIAAASAPGRAVCFCDLIGSHPGVAPCLARALTAALDAWQPTALAPT